MKKYNKMVAVMMATLCFCINVDAADKVVGDYNGQFSVSSSGAAIYTVPITCPKGVNDLEPKVSLTYNSQSKIGFAGIGWNISAYSVITKACATLYYDEKILPINYDNSADYLALDGQRLLKIQEISDDEAEFKTEIDNNCRIIRKGKNGNYRFEIYTPEGLKKSYSQLSDGAEYYEGNLGWFLTEIMDKNGNYITYEYSASNANKNTSSVILKSILYGGNKKTDMEHSCEIIFNYNNFLLRPLEYVIGGYKKNHYEILSDISTFANDTLNTKYTLTYGYDAQDRRILKKVTKYGNNGDYLEDLEINWNPITETLAESRQEFNYQKVASNYTEQKWFTADYSGDGVLDMISHSIKGSLTKPQLCVRYFKNDGNGNFTFDKSSYTDINLFSNSGFGGAFSSNITSISKKDVILPCLLNDKKTMVFYNIKKLDDNLSVTLSSEHEESPLFACADLNNDGLSDIVIIERKPYNDSYICSIYFGKKVSSLSMLRQDVGFVFDCDGTIQRINLSDMNGDGLLDIIAVSDKGYTVIKNKGNKQSAGYSSFYDPNTTFNTDMCYDPTKGRIFEYGDFNGDGVCDYYKGDGLGGFLYLGSANCTFKAYQMGGNVISTTTADIALAADVDGDGKSELAIISKKGNSVIWYRYEGSLFTIFGNSLNEKRTLQKENIIFGDVDTDGRVEILSLGNSLIGSSCTENYIYTTRLSSDIYGGLVSKITSPMNDISISYGNIVSTPGLHSTTIAFSTEFSLTPVTLPLVVVRSYKEQPKNGIARSYGYNYGNGYIQTTGKGFLGFCQITVTDSLSKINTLTEQKIITAPAICTYPYLTSKIYRNTIFSLEQNDFLIDNYGPNSRGCSLMRSKTTRKDLQKNTTETYEYSKYKFGKPTVICMNLGAGVKENTEYKDLLPNEPFNVFLPQTVVVTNTNNGGSVIRTKKMSYDVQYNLIKETEFFNTDKEKTTKFAYNENGTLRKKETSAKGCETRTLDYGYTPSGRFRNFESDSYGEELRVTYNEGKGRITNTVRTAGRNSQTTKFNLYDGFNNCLKSTYPDGRVRIISYKYDDSFKPGVYSCTDSITGSPTTYSLYDSYGREVKTSHIYADGVIRNEFKVYDQDGRLTYHYMPTTSATPVGNMYYEHNTYDRYGRLISTATLNGTTLYSYNKTDITTESPLGTNTKSYNEAGQLVTSTENGKIVDFTYNPLGKVSTSTAQDLVTKIEYDIAGNRTVMEDPDLGTVSYEYDAYGRVTSINDDKDNSIYYVYDKKGRLVEDGDAYSKWIYSYGDDNLLQKVEGDDYTCAYEYDEYDRITKKTVNTAGESFKTVFGYDNKYGQANTITYPSGVVVYNTFNNYGYHIKTECEAKSVWSVKKLDDYGRLIEETLPGNVSHSYKYTDNGQIATEKAAKGSNRLMELNYKYDGPFLSLKTDNISGNSESYTYNTLNQLSEVSAGNSTGVLKGNHTYDERGNMMTTWDNYWRQISYGENMPPHQVSSVSYTDASVAKPTTVKFNSYLKATQIDNGTYRYTLNYDHKHQRIKTCLFKYGKLQYTTYYLENYERIVYPDRTREIHYIPGGDNLSAIYVRCSNNDTLFAAVTDRQNSLTAVMDAETEKVERFSYKPWGMRRNPYNWSLNVSTDFKSNFHRGFCMHEHIEGLGMINMNSRIYNEQTCQFLSADPLRQSPDSWLSCNRFAYCMNNPVMRTDPTGNESVSTYYTGLLLQQATDIYNRTYGNSIVTDVPITVCYDNKFECNTNAVQYAPISTPYSSFFDAGSIYVGGSLSLFLGVNFSLEIGYMRNEGFFLAGSYGRNIGIDASFGGGIKTSNYKGYGEPSFENYAGMGHSNSVGVGPVDLGYSHSYDYSWESYNLGLSFGIPASATIQDTKTVVSPFSKIIDDIYSFPLELNRNLERAVYSLFPYYY